MGVDDDSLSPPDTLTSPHDALLPPTTPDDILSPRRMDAPIPSHPFVDVNNRPPGGTRRSGAKTPRKVQWQDDDSAEGQRRALDEHGLDVSP